MSTFRISLAWLVHVPHHIGSSGMCLNLMKTNNGLSSGAAAEGADGIENAVEPVLGDADAVVPDAENGPVDGSFQDDLDRRALGGKLDGVGEEVSHRQHQVAADGAYDHVAGRMQLDGDTLGLRAAGMLGDDFLHKVVKDKAHGLQPDGTALGTGPAEDIVDQLHFRLGLALELEQHFAKFLPGHAGVVGPEHLHTPKLRDGGRMDIVGDDPEQEVLLLVALAQPALAPLDAKACEGNDRGDNQQEDDNQRKGLFLARRPGDFQVLDCDGVLAPGGLVLDIEKLEGIAAFAAVHYLIYNTHRHQKA